MTFGSGHGAIHLDGAGKIVAAVSGGGDSVAMLHMLRDHVETLKNPPEILVATVDHGLRAASVFEALSVGASSRALGMQHEVLRWEGEKAETGIMAAARMARYALLSEFAKSNGASIVLTGHTANDNFETVSMNAKRAEDGRGNAGISPATLYERRVWFGRPMLGRYREPMRDYLRERNIRWFDDPSNFNRKYERVRTREDGAEEEVDRLQSASRARFQEGQDAAALLVQHVRTLDRSQCIIPRKAAEQDGFDLMAGAISCLIGQSGHLPALPVAQKIATFFKDASSGEKLTAHGCLYTIGGDQVSVKQESRNEGDGVFRYDHLMPVEEYPLARVIYGRLGEDLPPAPPLAAVMTAAN